MAVFRSFVIPTVVSSTHGPACLPSGDAGTAVRQSAVPLGTASLHQQTQHFRPGQASDAKSRPCRRSATASSCPSGPTSRTLGTPAMPAGSRRSGPAPAVRPCRTQSTPCAVSVARPGCPAAAIQRHQPRQRDLGIPQDRLQADAVGQVEVPAARSAAAPSDGRRRPAPGPDRGRATGRSSRPNSGHAIRPSPVRHPPGPSRTR